MVAFVVAHLHTHVLPSDGHVPEVPLVHPAEPGEMHHLRGTDRLTAPACYHRQNEGELLLLRLLMLD